MENKKLKATIKNMVKQFIYRSLLFCFLVLVLIFLIFSIRTIIDPYYTNMSLLQLSKKIFMTFTWPFVFFTGQINDNPGITGFQVQPLWTTLGIISNLLYFMILGNAVFYIFEKIRDLLKT
ncbi:MAG TPA: hypothetical protein PLE74_02890 [Candidatus Cloacimonadota bacterium]|nr:hypothetical protein [Candidatus Cloacimonadota bacterium]HPT71207.1 hypothetical protein [Candidatus Cloacimonadota bacterium]